MLYQVMSFVPEQECQASSGKAMLSFPSLRFHDNSLGKQDESVDSNGEGCCDEMEKKRVKSLEFSVWSGFFWGGFKISKGALGGHGRSGIGI